MCVVCQWVWVSVGVWARGLANWYPLQSRSGLHSSAPARFPSCTASTPAPNPTHPPTQVCILTSAFLGAETSGNVMLDISGERGSSGVVTLRNRGGASFRAGQVLAVPGGRVAVCVRACMRAWDTCLLLAGTCTAYVLA